ncbi:hypothetical protein AK830_g9953 [Neonectria ditissima]|uniref:SMP domain-containing protein n=1 Tax=Neonectria ditissima TaxID=78410 RepID=A0A0P7AGU2_9HYPO|nr:hypothetical protein AK830_g9953 [Neonectria ditissima]
MPTREVVSQFAQAESQALGEGPVVDSADHVPQSLLDKHHNLAARPNNPTSQNPAPPDDETHQTGQNRVKVTGARTQTSNENKTEEEKKSV